MRNANKFLACTLVATSIFAVSLPALADTSTQSAAPASSQVQNASSGTAMTPAERAAARKQKLQNEILHLQNAEQFQQNLAPIRQLQSQNKQLFAQIKTLRATVRAQVKTDRQAKNYTALLAALNYMIPMQDDIATAQETAQTDKADWVQLRTDNKANNSSAVTADLSKIQTDLQNRMTDYQKILTDLQKIDSDLGTPAPAASPTSSTTSTSAPST